MKILVYFIFVFGLSLKVLAGGTVGNGGDVVACKANGEIKYKFYDYYEAEKLRKIKIDLGPANISVQKKIQLALTRLNNLDRRLAATLSGFSMTFMSESFFSDEDLVDIPDTGNLGIPSGCEIKQLAIQREPKIPGDKRFTIDEKIWSKLSNDDQAGLILHEIILRHARTSKNYFHADTERVRYFNSVVSSSSIEALSIQDYLKLQDIIQLCPSTATIQNLDVRTKQENCGRSYETDEKNQTGFWLLRGQSLIAKLPDGRPISGNIEKARIVIDLDHPNILLNISARLTTNRTQFNYLIFQVTASEFQARGPQLLVNDVYQADITSPQITTGHGDFYIDGSRFFGQAELNLNNFKSKIYDSSIEFNEKGLITSFGGSRMNFGGQTCGRLEVNDLGFVFQGECTGITSVQEKLIYFNGHVTFFNSGKVKSFYRRDNGIIKLKSATGKTIKVGPCDFVELNEEEKVVQHKPQQCST